MKKILLLVLLATQLHGAASSTGESLYAKVERLSKMFAGTPLQRQQAVEEISRNRGLLPTLQQLANNERGNTPPGPQLLAQAVISRYGAESAASSGSATSSTPSQSSAIDPKDRFWIFKAAIAGNAGALETHKASITKEALQAQNSSGQNPLQVAIVNGHLPVVKKLIELGASVEDRSGAIDDNLVNPGNDTALGIALKELRRPSKRELRTSDDREAKPSNNKLIEIVEYLLADPGYSDGPNADPNAKNNAQATPLHLLSGFLYEQLVPRDKQGKVRAIDINEQARPDLALAAQLLVNAGNRRGGPIGIDAQDMFGNTPLHWTAIHGYYDLTNFLLKNGANPNSLNDQQQSALMKASQSGFLKIMKLLIDNGANVNARDTVKGRTPLHWAQRMREGGRLKRGDQMTKERALDVAKLLIQHGANPNIKDNPWTNPETRETIPGRSVIEWAELTSPWPAAYNYELQLYRNAGTEGGTHAGASSSTFSGASSSAAQSSRSGKGWWQSLAPAYIINALSEAYKKNNTLLEQIMQVAVDNTEAMRSYTDAVASGDRLAVEFRNVSGM